MGSGPTISIVAALRYMGNSSKTAVFRNAFRSALLVVLMPFLAGCATSKSRLAKPPNADSPQPAAVHETQGPATDSPSSATVEPPAASAEVRPVAYQQIAEEIPSLSAPDAVCPLDMSTALALVAGKNPQVAFSQARIREAYANLQAANVLWLPTIQTGVSYHRDEGNLQDSTGTILDVNRSSLQAGLGAGAVGAERQRNRGSSPNFIWSTRYSSRRSPSVMSGLNSTPVKPC